MLIIKNKYQLQQNIQPVNPAGITVGFVPTMGTLHEGHLTLVDRAIKENGIVVVSIFVNPTQFNDRADFARYPRDTVKDAALLASRLREGDVLFLPSEKEVYPQPDTRIFDFGGLDRFMEGKHRPGHFNGVAQVVTRLFDLVLPTRAYFGEKDFQQLSIIQYITKQMGLPVEIVPCPIVREPDGLAMSSRNVLLSPGERNEATKISRVLFAAEKMAPKVSLSEIKKWVTDTINSSTRLDVEYFEIVDPGKLTPREKWGTKRQLIACIAVRVGKVRLIDNIRISL